MTNFNYFSCFIAFGFISASFQCIPEYAQNLEKWVYSNKTTQLISRYSNNESMVEIASIKTCNITAHPTKEILICYQGKCVSKLVPINQTHQERVTFCLCAEVK